jgi:NCS1 family nucleobase:cation symporter-1
LNTSERKASLLIEKHTIGCVPPEDRHGKVRDLFTLWFGGNIAPLPIVTGALGVQIFHLNLLWGHRGDRRAPGSCGVLMACIRRKARKCAFPK